MSFLSKLFGFGGSSQAEIMMNPLLAMRLHEFAISEDDPSYTKHYFRFDDKAGRIDEFVVIYQRWGSDIVYLRTHWRSVGKALDFFTLSERGPWSASISYLIQRGQVLSKRTAPVENHFVSKISTGDLLESNISTHEVKTEPPSKAAEGKPPSESFTDEKKLSSPVVKASGWQQRGSTITKTFDISDLSSAQTTITVKISCYVTRYLNGHVDTSIRFSLSPYLFLMPTGKPFKSHLTTAPFLVCLFASGAGAGTDKDPIMRGGMFEVTGCSKEDDPDTALLDVNDAADVMTAVKAISTGETLTFSIYDKNADPPIRTKFQLPNDGEFSRSYGRLRNSV